MGGGGELMAVQYCSQPPGFKHTLCHEDRTGREKHTQTLQELNLGEQKMSR